jgi:predicted NBD/HSP70 family sugar kinase
MVANMRELSRTERRLIEMVATKGPIARTDLAPLLGLTVPSVTRAVASLDGLGLFDEQPDRQGVGGQPKRLIKLRAGRFFSAGLTFSRKSIELVILDLAGAIIGRTNVRIERQPPLAVAEAASKALDHLLGGNGLDRADLVGLGCGMPVNFGPAGTRVTAHGVFRELEEPEIMRRFLASFDLPTILENDANTAAIGEYIYGRRADDGTALFLLHIAFGVGGGAVIDGVPFYGVNGNACLPGFLYPDGAPRPSGVDLIETLAREGYAIEDFSDVECLMPDCPPLDAWIARAGGQLALAVQAATGFIDPSVIVVGGRMPRAINERLVEHALSNAGEGPSRGVGLAPVRVSTLGPEGGALGAACLPLFAKFFNGHSRSHEFRTFSASNAQ